MTGLLAAGILAAFLLVLIFTLTDSVNAVSRNSGELSAVQSESGLQPLYPGQFLTGPNEGEPLDIALDFIQANRSELQMSEAEVSRLVVNDLYVSQKTNTTHIYFIQTHNGIEVHNTIININIAHDGSVINLGNRAVPNLSSAIQTTLHQLTAEEAVG
jgi:Zn-dependent metalloprotease